MCSIAVHLGVLDVIILGLVITVLGVSNAGGVLPGDVNLDGTLDLEDVVLSLQIRQRKDETAILHRIGGGRNTVQALLGLELAILLAAAAVLAAALTWGSLAVIRSLLLG